MNFNDCDRQQQINFLTSIDNYSDTNTDKNIQFFHGFKWFVISGYYTSKEGASMELNYDPMPGIYRGCLPYTKADKAWSA